MIIFKDDEILLDLPKMLSETDLIKDIENRYIQIEPPNRNWSINELSQ